jgi:hypothetical protein
MAYLGRRLPWPRHPKQRDTAAQIDRAQVGKVFAGERCSRERLWTDRCGPTKMSVTGPCHRLTVRTICNEECGHGLLWKLRFADT